MIEYSSIQVNGIKIAYLEKNKTASQIIFFIHGNSTSKQSWRKQYNSELFYAYHLIALDLPGHGGSGFSNKPNDNYTLQNLAHIMSLAVTQLSNHKPYIIAGVSLSTNITVEMLAFNINPAGLVLAGPCLVGKDYPLQNFVQPGTHVGVVFTNHPAEEEVLLYAKETSLTKDEEDIDIFMQDYKATDNVFREALAASITAEQYSDEIALLKQSNIISFIAFGKDEKIVDPSYLDAAPLRLWNNKVFKIEDAGHLLNIDNPGAFNPLLKAFADAVFAQTK